MSFDAHANFAISTVATAPSPASSGTTLIVAAGDGAKFPAVPFNATVWPANSQPTSSNAEIVRVTGRSTDTLTITRSQESSSARAISVGDQIAATITKKTLTDIEAVAGLLHTVSSSGSSLTVDYSTASTWDITLSANCTFALSGFTSGDPDFLTLILRQDATGSRTVTWPTITWIGSGIAPTLQTAASSVDSVVLFSVDGGTTVYGIAQTSASGLKSGTSFPGSPSDGDLFYRTDTNILYFYKSAVTKWLSVDRKYVAFGEPVSLSDSTTSGTLTLGRIPIWEDIYVEAFKANTYVDTTNNGSNFWTVSLLERNSSLSATTLATFNTSADTASTGTKHAVAVNAIVLNSSFLWLDLATLKTGTPGSGRVSGLLICRSVG